MLRTTSLLLIFVSISAFSRAQSGGASATTVAFCTFNFFKLSVNVPNSGISVWRPAGINDFGTVVGSATPDVAPATTVAVVRWKNGTYSFPLGTVRGTHRTLNARNDKGSSIGSKNFVPIILNGTALKVIDFSRLPQLQSVNSVTGINIWGSIVGSYNTLSSVNGFKRWSNGHFLVLKFPEATSTFPASINDNGTVVGSYFSGHGGHGGLPENGFVYQNGEWATLNYPGAISTHLVGISNAGVVVGNAIESDGGFLYRNGQFKRISTPDGSPTEILAISTQLGLIVGDSQSGGFIARCK